MHRASVRTAHPMGNANPCRVHRAHHAGFAGFAYIEVLIATLLIVVTLLPAIQAL